MARHTAIAPIAGHLARSLAPAAGTFASELARHFRGPRPAWRTARLSSRPRAAAPLQLLPLTPGTRRLAVTAPHTALTLYAQSCRPRRLRGCRLDTEA
ncbi:hypothetical protein [Chitinilyticum litopenaei]|uniref:hypothetical protein n=1 Tax=Chitinilyticum litopenaei TaxID=1121276 RepID=UPI0004902BC3|nr:hypothetical protein [Chitinilyticum litopenaei]